MENTIPSEPSSRGELKKLRQEEAIRNRKMKKIGWIVGSILALAALIGGGIWYDAKRDSILPGVLVSDQGRPHVGTGHGHTYNSNPPTSGPHFAQVADWGVYKEELPDETLIHNLEHGGVWISYKPDISEDTRLKLENFYQQWGRKVIVAPRSKNDTDIALAAWNRLDKFNAEEFTEDRVNRFIKAYRNKGPEFVP